MKVTFSVILILHQLIKNEFPMSESFFMTITIIELNIEFWSEKLVIYPSFTHLYSHNELFQIFWNPSETLNLWFGERERKELIFFEKGKTFSHMFATSLTERRTTEEMLLQPCWIQSHIKMVMKKNWDKCREFWILKVADLYLLFT